MNILNRNILYNAINQGLVTIFPVLTIPIVLRAIPPDIYGKYVFYQSIIQYCIVFVSLGYDYYAVREVASLSGKILKERVAQLFYLRFFIGVSLLILIQFAGCFFVDGKLMFFLQSFLILSNLFNVNWLVTGAGDFKIVATRQLLGKLILFTLIVFFVHKPTDVYIYIFIQFLSDFIPNLAVLYKYRKFLKFNFKSIKKKNIVRTLFHEFSAIKFLFAVQIFIVIGVNFDKTILAFYAKNNNDLGIYAVAYNIFIVIYSFLISTGPVLLFSSTKKITSNNQNFWYLKASLFISIFCFIVLFFGKDLFFLFVGQKYESSYSILLLLLVKLPFAIFSNWIINTFLLPQRLDKAYFYFFLAFTIVSLTCTFFLIKVYGIYGAITATIITEFFLFLELLIYYLITIKRKKNVKVIPNE